MNSVATETPRLQKEPYLRLVERLSQLSVKKHYEAYRDVEWDGPDSHIDPDDPRFCLGVGDAIAQTEWYRGLPPELQSRFGLEWICEKLKIGIAFESLLSIGLLEFTQRLPNGSPEYRYAMHEVVEESQHSMMFQEFINRAGVDPKGLSDVEMRAGRRIARMAGTFPEFFFFFVLAGEIFIDRDNRDHLRNRGAKNLHPVLHKLLQIHVTEEARHVCFAERYLQENLPYVSRFRALRLRFGLPNIMRQGERLMLKPSGHLVRKYEIPRSTLKEAYGRGTPHEARVREIVSPVFALMSPVVR